MNLRPPTEQEREWYRSVYLASSHWADLRRSKLTLAPCCEDCGSTDCLDVHHVDYRNLWDVTVECLRTLCRTCHTERHRKLGRARAIARNRAIKAARGTMRRIKDERKKHRMFLAKQRR